MSAGSLPYPEVPASPSLPEIEATVLQTWADRGTFEISVSNRAASTDGGDEYVFYDGPPFANGLPHYGHLLTGYVKDAVPRYQTMLGRRVERRFGWDCHGLPAEIEAEKELGVSGRGPITDFGIDRFNDYCRTSVLRYAKEWQHYVTRQARWVDFENDYKTMDLSYMESVMWAVRQLWDKGLLYEGYRVSPYCWECETVLSNFETRQDNAYRDRQDPAVTVAFHLDSTDLDSTARDASPDRRHDRARDTPSVLSTDDLSGDNVELWVWTTTPWTLPSNLAIAVGADLSYAVFDLDGRRVVLGENTVEAYGAQLDGAIRVGTVRGADLVGRRYKPLFDYFAFAPNAFVVLAGDFVATDEGTGIVHMAPGFGEDDQRACEAIGIAVVCPVDDRARFTSEVPDFAGLQVFEANTPITRALRQAGALIRSDSYVHSYPHCWRTDTPLIYKAVSSWFVRVTAIKERMLELNKSITWVPAHVRDGAFGKWLENARDWPISRNRFWGSPIPIWQSDDPQFPRVDVYGSLDEIEADFGVRPTDLHRPSIDELTRPNPDDPTGQSTMRRVSDVLDCWFESGSMPFAQVHYPFEHKEWFDEHFPANFIVEYIGQTRGWFYTLHVLATALFDRQPFEVCLAHGVVLGDDGQKMSKRLRNYPDPEAMFAKYGADAMRWFLLSSPVLRGGDMVADEEGIRVAVRQAVLPLWNVWSFFTLYANAENYRANRGDTSSPALLDRYMLAKTRHLIETVTARMDNYELSGACRAVEDFLEVLTNWYVRRSRDRFWATDSDSAAGTPTGTKGAFDTLATVLEVLCRVSAPLLPMLSESIWSGLTGEQSVHLTDWPDPDLLPIDADLVGTMDRVRDVCSAAHSVRKACGLRARLPLASLTVAAPNADRLAGFVDLIADEVNVKQVILSTALDDLAHMTLSVVFKVAAPRLGPATQAVAAAAKRGQWTKLADGRVDVGGHVLEAGEFELRLQPLAEQTSRALPGDDGLVVLDVAMTAELEAEGAARDVVRVVQQARRDAGLHVTDRIELSLGGGRALLERLERHIKWIAEQTLALNIARHDLASYTEESSAPPVELPGGELIVVGLRTAK